MGKGLLKNIFSNGASNLVSSVGDAIDKNVTSDEERLQLKNEFTKIIQDHEYLLDAELTKRHQADMTSDSKLSKLIRPMTLIYMTTFLTTLVITDSIEGIDFTIASHWVTLLGVLLTTVFSFYFGGREIQKWLINKNK